MRYHLVDESRYPNGKAGSLTGFIMRLENTRLPQDFQAALEEMTRSVPKHLDSVKRAMAVWIIHVLAPHKGIKLNPRNAEDLDEVTAMLALRIEQWEVDIRKEERKEGEKEGRTEGRKEGRKEGKKDEWKE